MTHPEALIALVLGGVTAVAASVSVELALGIVLGMAIMAVVDRTLLPEAARAIATGRGHDDR